MKIIITESQKGQVLKNLVRDKGFKFTSNLVGGYENLKNAIGVHSSQEFLNLFSNLDRVESEENPGVFLCRYKKGKNVMVIDERDSENGNIIVYINYDVIFGPLALFGKTIMYSDKIVVLKKWLKDTYGIRPNHVQIDLFIPGSEDFGFYEFLI